MASGSMTFTIEPSKVGSISESTNTLLVTDRTGEFRVIASEPNNATTWVWQSLEDRVAGVRGRGNIAEVTVLAQGTTNISVAVDIGDGNKVVGGFTLVVAPNLVIYGPDGNYYCIKGSAWSSQDAIANVDSSVKALVKRGSALFDITCDDSVKTITCYVLNLASLSNRNINHKQ